MKPNATDGTMGFGAADASFGEPVQLLRGASIETLGLSNRALNALRYHVETVDDLVQRDEHQLLRMKWLGRVSVDDIKHRLAVHGLALKPSPQKKALPPSLVHRVAQLEAALGRVAIPVNIECFTNLDKFRGARWPTTAAYAPQKGECIEGRSWDGREVIARLHVVQITHCVDREGKPCLRVELHL